MKKLKLIAATLITASALSTSAFAANDDSARDEFLRARASVDALVLTLEKQGATVDATVNLKHCITFKQKEAAYILKHAELQAQYDSLKLNK